MDVRKQIEKVMNDTEQKPHDIVTFEDLLDIFPVAAPRAAKPAAKKSAK